MLRHYQSVNLDVLRDRAVPVEALSPRDEIFSELYAYSQARLNTHFEGASAIDATLDFVQKLREAGLKRITIDEMGSRLSGVLGYSEQLFIEFPEVRGVVFFGSAQRGRPRPNDFDLMVAIDRINNDRDGMQEKDRVQSAITLNPNLPVEIHGIKVELAIASCWTDEERLGLSFMNQCPFFAILRGQEVCEGIVGPSRVFCNFAGTLNLKGYEKL